ncbi:MAG: LytTR family DNA-binding domain-containing protein [Herbinix sp.]|nr:LytTR family DNA-binding domain-containing protein [Herbinix sp.]
MLVGICDDEEIIRNELIRLCEKYKASNMSDLDIKCFSSGEELIACKQPIDILFLDIQMKGLNGLKTAEKIRENDESMTIIFLTGFRGFMQAGYKVRAFRYLLKPVNEQEFIQSITEAIKDITKNSKAIVGLDGDIRFVKLKDIIYVEYVDRYTVVRTKKGTYESATSMNEWENILNTGDFFRVHKAYIVNMEYIDEIGKEIQLDNGEKVEVSFRQVAKLKKACKAYRRRNAR